MQHQHSAGRLGTAPALPDFASGMINPERIKREVSF
jgi:hypothetical protein